MYGCETWSFINIRAQAGCVQECGAGEDTWLNRSRKLRIEEMRYMKYCQGDQVEEGEMGCACG